VQPQSAPPDCGFSTSATPKAFGAISPAGIPPLSLQKCNDRQDKFFARILLRQLGQRPLYYYNIVTGMVAFKPGQTGISLAPSDCLAFAEAILKELNRR
jgi:hypothetical protein